MENDFLYEFIIKEENGKAINHPMFINDFKTISGMSVFTEQDILSSGHCWFEYTVKPEDTHWVEYVDSGYKKLESGVYTNNYTAVTIPEEQAHLPAMRRYHKNKRENLLISSDYTQLADSPFTPEMKSKWSEYRQALRDITEQEGYPYNVTYPDAPVQPTEPTEV